MTTVASPAGADAALVADAEALADRLLAAATATRDRRERRQGRRIARLLADPAGLEWITAVTDEVLRIREPARAARHLASIPVPAAALGPVDRRLLGAGLAAARLAPGLVVPLVRARVRAELSGFVIDAADGPLGRHLARRRAEGVTSNVNLLGEAVLGDGEAADRLARVRDLVRRPDVTHVSVKVSSVCAQLHVAAFDHEVDRVAAALRTLYADAAATTPPTFVTLDMEGFADLDLTVEAALRVLSEPAFHHLAAGIVLQAYLPDSLARLDRLAAWARARRDAGGAPLRVRIVKGANLAVEGVEAELAGWPRAPWPTKADTDAAYKRMLDVALDPANAGALRVGVASHNLFEAAWALTLARHRGLADMVEPEMLEGMAPSMAAAVRAEAGSLLLYTPVAPRDDFESVIAYLVRRFDENAGPENFLRHQFDLAPGSAQWRAERDRFLAAVAARHHPAPATRRTQDRSRRPGPAPTGRFANEPDTDPTTPANRAWLADVYGAPAALADLVTPVVAGDALAADGRDIVVGVDPARPDEVAYRWVACSVADVDRALAAAGPAGERWRARPRAERSAVVAAVGDALAADRAGLLAVMATDCGKTFAEADPEVSEAIDFARWYARAGAELDDRFRPYRTVAVVPPWNFPLAIPAGGVLAALAAGAAVVLKPAPEAVAVAARLAAAAWAAGVPRDLLQLLPCADGPAAEALVRDPRVEAVVLTGSWATARTFLGWRPDLALHAETSGKNALVVTATADLDAAVGDLVRSAFGHAGQKCSAASLAIVERAVADDPRFLRQLADATASLRPGPGWRLDTTIGPLIRPAEGPLARALTTLEPGERWLVEPRLVGGDRLWSPGVKLGVAAGSPFHLDECFGPVLGVMVADDLTQATEWQNAVAYGLTAGLHALDPAEIAWWRDHVLAGNLYVNRHTTGAIVGRQPFGGWKRSVVGPGAKAGGAHYVASLGRWHASFDGDDDAFAAAVAAELAGPLAPADRCGLEAEANVVRHLPLPRVVVRAGPATAAADLALALAAARGAGVEVEVSSPVPLATVTSPVVVETDDDLVARLARARPDKLRLIGGASDRLRLGAHDAGAWVDDRPVVADPAVEVLAWVRAQALSETRHRHGDVNRRRPGPLAGAMLGR